MSRSMRENLAHLFHPRFSNNHRPRLIHPEGFLVLFLMVVVATFSFSNAAHFMPKLGWVLGYSSTINISQVVEQTNRQRQILGLQPLQTSEVLNRAAVAKANNMFAEQYWAHYSPSGKSPWQFIVGEGYRYQVAGENLARDFMQTEDMVRAWMNSPTHRENIVNPRYREIGIGVVNGVLQGVETTLVVQMFGTQRVAPRSEAIDEQAEQIADSTPLVEEIAGESSEFIAQVSDLELEETNVAEVTQGQEVEFGVNQVAGQRVAGAWQQVVEHRSPLSPLHISKAFFLAVILLVLSVLLYDMLIISNRQTVRFVGKNLAHILLFLSILFLIVVFKGGVVV